MTVGGNETDQPQVARYRADIDGLRAIAVSAVIVFHVFPDWLKGGFVGVDIFFVISGYLISRLLLSDLQSGKFTIRRFYARRIRRIFPALATVLLACAVAGWLFLFPDEWQRLGLHLLGGSTFVANLVMLRGAGYFDGSARASPLLHLWSLGVEEQFYFVWPLLLMILWRFRRHGHSILMLIVAGSFILNVATVNRWPTYTFYLPVTRVWELGLGSLLAWFEFDGTVSRLRLRRSVLLNVASVLGLAMCVAAMVVTREAGFPGAWALLPTVGTMLLIAAGPAAAVNKVLLSSRPLVGVGLISYPLYLWHWPLLSFLLIWSNRLPPRFAWAICVVAALVLSVLTYKFIESPVRHAPVTSRGLQVAVAVMLLVAVIGGMAAGGLWEPRVGLKATAPLNEAVKDWSSPYGNFGLNRNFRMLVTPRRPEPATLFIGDSHIEQYWSRIESVSRSPHGGIQLRFATNGGCPPLRGIGRGPVCDSFLGGAMNAAHSPAVDTVVFGAAWVAYLSSPRPEAAGALNDFTQRIVALRREGKRVFVVLSNPSSESFDPRRMVSRISGRYEPPPPLPLEEFLKTAGPAIRSVRDAAERGGATIIDPLPVLCPDGQCPAVTPDGLPIYKDASHLRSSYVLTHATFIDQIFAPRQR